MSQRYGNVDFKLDFPHFSVLKASAGSGKTYALSRRFAGFLLSDKVPKNALGNLLAVTFSNNAAREMKERVLDLLKGICLGDEKLVKEFAAQLGLSESRLIEKAEEVVNTVLANYSDFQVKTIDSFMTSVFKASAIDFGYSPDFDVVMNNADLMGYAFDLFLRKVRKGTKESLFMEGVVDAMLGNRGGDLPYPWNPAKDILDEIKDIYRRLATYGKPVNTDDHAPAIRATKRRIGAAFEELDEAISQSGLVRSGASSYERLKEAAEGGRFPDLIGKGMKNPPVCKPKPQGNHEAYHDVQERWQDLAGLITMYSRLYASAYYSPYLKTYEGFSDILERVKKHEGKVFIEDINKKLAEYLNEKRVPDVYLRLGEVIYHYLIDEFQDTSPIQWQNLLPLLDNSLAQGGSLFVVGDTKQAIYGFRDADYRIMKGVESRNDFPSALHSVEELDTNYRSDGAIVTFTKRVFQQVVPQWEEYRTAACESGLLDYQQEVNEDRPNRGYVQTCLLERNDSQPQERERLYKLLEELTGRGYRHSDITILASKNSDVVRITSWLNSKGIPFLSYSSLDIRKRKITGEIVALLNFLDSPLDDLSFATFILGDIFQAVVKDRDSRVEREVLHELCFRHRSHDSGPLYKVFQTEMEELWDAYFARLFRSSGYLPVYDLVAEVYAVFDVFRLFGREEEAVLVKILEVVKNLESEGRSSLRSFLRFASASQDDDGDWNVDVPYGIEAVNVMTIHKSKGLGFPVVILLLYGERSRGHRYIVREDPDSVSLLRLTRGIAAIDETFGSYYDKEEIKDRVSKLNSLYVAFTRAGSELYVIGVKRERESFPFSLFPDCMAHCEGQLAEVAAKPGKTSPSACAFHLSIPFECGTGSEDSMRFEEKRRGELMHRLFSSIEYLDEAAGVDLSRTVREMSLGMGIEVETLESLAAQAVDFLRGPLINGYYERKPGRRVFVEREIADSDGRLFRVDRIVIDPGNICVVEYKTGGDHQNEGLHLAQMRNYLRIVREIHPDSPVEGIIAYVDLKKIRRVGEDG